MAELNFGCGYPPSSLDMGHSTDNPWGKKRSWGVTRLMSGKGWWLVVKRVDGRLVVLCSSLYLFLHCRSGVIMAAAAESVGWSALHHAAYANHVSLVERLAVDNMDAPTNDSAHNTALLLAATSGSLQTVSLLVKLGADVAFVNARRQGVVDVCILGGHLDLLTYFIALHHQSLNVYEKLVALLDDESDVAVRSCAMISALINQSEDGAGNHLTRFIEEGLVSASVEVLRRTSGDRVKAETLNLLRNVLRCKDGRRKFVEAKGVRILASLVDVPYTKTFPVIMDTVCELSDDFGKELLTFVPVITKHASFLDEATPEEAVLAVLHGAGRLATSSPSCQDAMGAQSGPLPIIVRLFQLCQSMLLLTSWSKCVGRIAEGNPTNQSALIRENADSFIRCMLRSKNRDVHMAAVETLYR